MNDRLLPIKVTVLCVGLMGTAAISLSHPQAIAQIAKPSSDQSSQLNAVIQQLSGKWQFLNSSTNSPRTIVYAPDGVVITSDTTGSQTFTASGCYKVNASTQPMQITTFVVEKDQDTTIFEFTPDGHLRLGKKYEATIPKKFAESVLLKKISNDTTLKPDAQAAKQLAGQSGEAEARLYLALLTQAQLGYYLKTKKFATSIAQLGLDLKSETADYRYQIVPQGDETRQIKLVGRAKRSGLKSFTGAVFSEPKDVPLVGESLSGLVCETFRASQLAPATPQYPSYLFKELQCPSGSQETGTKPLKN